MAEYAWHDLGDGRSVYRRVINDTAARSDFPCPRIASDVMDAAQHPCTGAMIDSKSRFREITKANGCVEIGNDPSRLRPRAKPTPDRKGIREAVQKAVAQAKN